MATCAESDPRMWPASSRSVTVGLKSSAATETVSVPDPHVETVYASYGAPAGVTHPDAPSMPVTAWLSPSDAQPAHIVPGSAAKPVFTEYAPTCPAVRPST